MASWPLFRPGISASAKHFASRHPFDHLQEQGETKRAEYQSLADEFKSFLQIEACQNVLDKDTVFDLIASHGNVDVMLFYAKQKGDYEVVLQHHLQLEQVEQAMEVLRDQGRTRPDLVYRFAPELIQSSLADLIRLARQFPNLEPRELIPAFVRYQQQSNQIDEKTMLIINYLGTDRVIKGRPRGEGHTLKGTLKA